MKKIDYAIQLDYKFFNNIKTNFSENLEIKANFLKKIGKSSLTQLTIKELLQLENNLKQQK